MKRKATLEFNAEIWSVIENRETIHTSTDYDGAEFYCTKNKITILEVVGLDED